jgi:hypothetical protein
MSSNMIHFMRANESGVYVVGVPSGRSSVPHSTKNNGERTFHADARLRVAHKRALFFGHKLSVVKSNYCSHEQCKYMIGVQLAKLLRRKTFNLYRCLKKKGVDVRRASADEVASLNEIGAIRNGTHSVTLVPYADALYFLADALLRNVTLPNESPAAHAKRVKAPMLMSTRPKLHRRKPFPWDVHRSIKNSSSLAGSSGATTTNRRVTRANEIPPPLAEPSLLTSRPGPSPSRPPRRAAASVAVRRNSKAMIDDDEHNSETTHTAMSPSFMPARAPPPLLKKKSPSSRTSSSSSVGPSSTPTFII